ncbi:MAG: pyridoxal phosphate-dependent aminotransferase [Firmicutes bacterium]|nr:pyridoxal phosphate-dependent aminotransferase [Bacillota bacterium]
MNSIKWDKVQDIYGCSIAIPMWVADMDFVPPEPVVEAVVQRAQLGFYGYESTPESYVEAFRNWLAVRHGWDVPEEWLAFSPGVVAGLSLAVETFTSPGDQIVIQPPVYHPFFAVIERNERVLVQNELVVEGGQYRIDFADLKRKFAQGAKTMIFCSPHNPVGRVWTETELQQLAELVKQYEVLVLADEIWADLTLPGHSHRPLASLNEDIASRCITFMAPSKTFNVAGFHLSNVIIRNDELRERYCKTMQRLSLGGMNAFGVRGAEAAYRHCAPWLDELRDYLKGNVEYTLAELEKRMPAIKVLPPEGTYLLWLDCRALPIPPDKLNRFLATEARVALNDGAMFGQMGVGFQRMNIACPRQTITKALLQMENAFEKL